MSDAGSDDVEYSQMARSYPKLIDDLQWARVTTVGPNLAEAQNINRLRWNSYVGKRD